MARITIRLETFERDALFQLADHEKRDPRQQAALLIRHELERLGMLPTPARAATMTGRERNTDDTKSI
jgi:hypothetical protein